MNTFTVNGKSSSDYNLLVTSDTWMNGAEIAYESYQIPKRMGDLASWQGRYNNILRTITLYHAEAGMRDDVEKFKQHVYSLPEGQGDNVPYSKLETSYDLSWYTYGTIVSFEVEPFKGKDGSATITTVWSCIPFYYQDGETSSTGNLTRTNYCGMFPVQAMTASGGVISRIVQYFPEERMPRYFLAYFVGAPASGNPTLTARALDSNGDVLDDCWVIHAWTDTSIDLPSDPYTMNVSNAVIMNPNGYIDDSANNNERNYVLVEPRKELDSVEIVYNGTTTTYPVFPFPSVVFASNYTVYEEFMAVEVDYVLTASQTGNSPLPLAPMNPVYCGTGVRSSLKKQSVGFFAVDFRSMSSNTIKELVNVYVVNGILTVHVDANRNVYVQSGEKKKSLNKYAYFWGDYGGIGNAAGAYGLATQNSIIGVSYEGYVNAVRFVPRWGKA